MAFCSPGQGDRDGVVERGGDVFIRGADLDELQADRLGDPLGDRRRRRRPRSPGAGRG